MSGSRGRRGFRLVKVLKGRGVLMSDVGIGNWEVVRVCEVEPFERSMINGSLIRVEMPLSWKSRRC